MHPPLSHYATAAFWACYRDLPNSVRALADKNFALLKHDPAHPSLRLKRIGTLWSVRVGLRYRALARDRAEGLVWYWIGSHADYDQILTSRP